MKKNKMLSLILALAMAFSLAAPSLASDSGNDKTISVQSKLQDQVIKVTMDTAPGAVLNPYGLGYSSRETAKFQNFDQVASKDNLIISQSNVPLDVAVKVAEVNAENDIILVTEDWTETDLTDRQVFMYAVFAELDTSKLTPTSTPSISHALDAQYKYVDFYPKDEATGAQMPIAYPSGNALVFEKTSNKAANAVYIPSEEDIDDEAEAQVVAHLDATNTTVTGTGSSATYASKTVSAVAYKMGGHMVAEPLDDEGQPAPWGASDKVTFKLAFSFRPTAADTRQQKIWAQDSFKIDIDNMMKLNNNAASGVINVSVDPFQLYKFSNYQTEWAYALSLLLPTGATEIKVGGQAAGTNGESSVIEEKHMDSGSKTAFVAIAGKKAVVAHKADIDADLDGYVMIQAASLATAAFAASATPTDLKIPVPIAFKVGNTAYSYVANVLTTIPTDDVATTMTRGTTTATLAAADMKTAIGGVSGTLGDVNLLGVTGDITDPTKVSVAPDGEVSVTLNDVVAAASRATYFTLHVLYTDTVAGASGADPTVTTGDKYVDIKLPATT